MFKMAAMGALVACAVVGCGGSDDPVADFVGTWQPKSGAVVLTCPSGSFSDTVTSTSVFTRGTTAALVQSDGTCSILFDVAGSTATARTGQTCTDSDGTVHFASWTFSTTDGKNASEAFSGTVVGSGMTCTANETATYTRISH
jgi:hypothetical protein